LNGPEKPKGMLNVRLIWGEYDSGASANSGDGEFSIELRSPSVRHSTGENGGGDGEGERTLLRFLHFLLVDCSKALFSSTRSPIGSLIAATGSTKSGFDSRFPAPLRIGRPETIIGSSMANIADLA